MNKSRRGSDAVYFGGRDACELGDSAFDVICHAKMGEKNLVKRGEGRMLAGRVGGIKNREFRPGDVPSRGEERNGSGVVVLDDDLVKRRKCFDERIACWCLGKLVPWEPRGELRKRVVEGGDLASCEM